MAKKFTESEVKNYQLLLEGCEESTVFKFRNLYVVGKKNDIILDYIKSESDKTFEAWLGDTGLILKIETEKKIKM